MKCVFIKFIQILITYLLLIPSVNSQEIIVFKFTEKELSEMEGEIILKKNLATALSIMIAVTQEKIQYGIQLEEKISNKVEPMASRITENQSTSSGINVPNESQTTAQFGTQAETTTQRHPSGVCSEGATSNAHTKVRNANQDAAYHQHL